MPQSSDVDDGAHGTTPPDEAPLTFFASAPRGMGKLLNNELRFLGARQVEGGEGGVHFHGDLETGYRVCLWSRFASRVLLHLADVAAGDQHALYRGVRALPWEDHVAADGSLAIGVTGHGAGIDNSHFGAQRIKDAIVDRFQTRVGQRPSVDLKQPDLRIHCHLDRRGAQLSIDLSGDGLHRRGYRRAAGEAPLKENLAAGMLQLAGWRSVAKAGAPLVDPMCGSGTLLIEAAMMAADIAPGLGRPYFGFTGWLGHVPALWRRLVTEAEARREAGLATLPPIVGFDRDARAIDNARANLAAAGLRDRVRVEVRAIGDCAPPPGDKLGLVVSNPPYGVRIGDDAELLTLHAEFGRVLRARCPGWRAAVITPRADLAPHLGLAIEAEHRLYNGALESHLYRMRVPDGDGESGPDADPAPEFANRLRKNLRHLGKWLRRDAVECYRLYDADLPDYAFAVDVYRDQVHVQEYAAPKEIDAVRAAARRGDALAAIARVLALAPAQVHFKVRERQRGSAQYERQAAGGREITVAEAGLRFVVNLDDFLDTGLFLDHRITRARVRDAAQGKRVLNLFAYTGSFSVYAAAGGARSTTTVDMSRTYLDWARHNMALNGFTGPQHRYVHADCLQWLDEADDVGRYDLIVLDPPSFSNSARMSATLDVQRDHVALLRAVLAHLAPEGLLVFSNNLRGFKLDHEALADLDVRDISAQTLPPDFQRRPNIHRCWEIRHRP